MKFYWLTGDVDWQTHGGTWISAKFNNDDFDYYLFREICRVDGGTTEYYSVTLGVVSIEEAAKTDQLEKAIASCGWEAELEVTEQMKIEALIGYGVYAHIKEFTGSNYQKLFKECRHEAETVRTLFALYMDRPQNALGVTGWDRLQGITIPQLEATKS